MVDISGIESLADRDVDCWRKHRPQYTGLYEDNDFGCETLQVFKSGYKIEAFSHSELCYLSTLLTRSLRGQINRDHKIFWSWCSFLTFELRDQVKLFQDGEWDEALRALVNLSLAAKRGFVAGPQALAFEEQMRKYVNFHLLTVLLDRHILLGPLAFAVLEGTLRRKNRDYVTNDGNIHTSFSVVDSNRQTKHFSGGKLNRIDDSLRLFEQVVTNNRGRPCSALGILRNEVLTLYPSTGDAYDLVDSWRNELVHGKEYWQNRFPVILNLICLLVIDEIEPSVYDGKISNIYQAPEWQRRVEAGFDFRVPWGIFPPDLDS